MRQTNILFGLILARANRGEEKKRENKRKKRKRRKKKEKEKKRKNLRFVLYWKHVYFRFLV